MQLKRRLIQTALLLMGCALFLELLPATRNAKWAAFAIWLCVILSAILFMTRLCVSLYLFSTQSQERKKWGRLFIVLGIIGSVLLVLLTVLPDIYARRLSVFHDTRQALDRSPEARAFLGGSVKIGWPIDMDMHGNHPTRRVILDIPVSGDDGKGDLFVFGTESNDVWTSDRIFLRPSGSTKHIVLLGPKG